MSDKYSIPSEADLSSDEEESHTEDDFDGIDAEFDEITLTQRVYSESSEILLASIENLWRDYCDRRKWNAQASLEAITTRSLYDFFFRMLKRRKKTLRSVSTLETYWKVFCVARERLVKSKLDKLIVVQMKNVLKTLARRFNLNAKKRKKTVMYAEDMFEALKAQWTSPEMTFDHERHRIELSLFVLLVGTTGNRPGALLALRYRDVQATLIQAPDGRGEPHVLLEFKYTCTRGRRSQRDRNTFTTAEIRHDPCLILSPHTYFLALAFSDKAFAAPDLTSPEAFLRLKIFGSTIRMRLPWKEEMLELPIFRKTCRTVRGIEISQEPLPYSTLRPWLRRLSDIAGVDQTCQPYILHCATEEVRNNCNTISNSSRNSVMEHSDLRVFQQHRHSSHISADIHPPDSGVSAKSTALRATSDMSRRPEIQRPQKLSPEQLRQIEMHPKVVKARNKMDELKLKTTQIKQQNPSDPCLSILRAAKDEAVRAYRNEKRRQKEALLREAKERFNRDSTITDIRGTPDNVPADDQEPVKHGYALEERSQAVQALLTLPEQTLDEERRRKSRAIAALVALSQKKEDRPGPQCSKALNGVNTSDADAVAIVDECAEPRNLKCKPTQCFLCLGDEDLSSPKREKEFCSRGDLKKHMLRYHLRHFGEDATVVCPLDGESLQGHADVLSHGQYTHGTPFLIR